MKISTFNVKVADATADNIAKIKEIFPEIFVGGGGTLSFEKLKAALGEYIADDDERYNFTWNGKAKAMRLAQTPSTATLRPCKSESKNWENTKNVYIEGDNLEVLKLLQKSYYSKIKMIYIDPPYNTGNDFVYADDYKDNIQNYLRQTQQVDDEGHRVQTDIEVEGRIHSNWLRMIYPRLKLARNLLTKDGIIFISIDAREVVNLKKTCNEIFGEDNFVGEIIWQTSTDNNSGQIAMDHEYIICYARDRKKLPAWVIKSEKAAMIQAQYDKLKAKYKNNTAAIQASLKVWIKKNVAALKGVAHYSRVDDKGVYYPGNASNTKPGGYTFDIIHPVTKKVCRKPDYGYRWPEATFINAKKTGDVEWGETEAVIPKIKKRLETATELLRSYYYEDNRYWTKYLNALLGKNVFENPKSMSLISRLMKFATNQDDIILDFFAGSATTAHAVMQLNADDGGTRKFMMIQLPEATAKRSVAYKKGYKNICEIGKERIRRTGDQIQETATDLDIGFRVFKLDSSNIEQWTATADNIKAKIIEELEENWKPFVAGRSDLDIVYEIALKNGLALTSEIEEIEMASAYALDAGKLLICLGEGLNKAVAAELLKLVPNLVKIVVRDNGFATDNDKMEFREYLQIHEIDEIIFI
ncbi:site-specific DNA-methyltransferase [Candidatus Epulonipiscium viviparus]|uniref:site-specific DNA-methyltransferase n=1 Tax=Candidatus Epulonipiscium viviparus TaxID=420336 RepID=UPI0027380A93|nr:site-specific DNA-methyltransferase [Candidatus Epulopiscium viviparus]